MKTSAYTPIKTAQGPASGRLPVDVREGILRHCEPSSFKVLRDLDEIWRAAARPAIARAVLTASGSPRGMSSKAPEAHLDWAMDSRASVLARHGQRGYTVPTKIWDFDGAELSPDKGMLLGVSDGCVLRAFDLEDDRPDALVGDWSALPIGWAANNSQLICRDERRQLVTVEPAEPTGMQLRPLAGSDRGRVSGWDLSWDRLWVAGASEDGRNWVTSLATGEVTELPRAPPHAPLCPRSPMYFVQGALKVLHIGPGGDLWITPREDPSKSRRLFGWAPNLKLLPLGNFPNLHVALTHDQVAVVDFSCWPPMRRPILPPETSARRLRILSGGDYWLTVGDAEDTALLWRFDGGVLAPLWRRRLSGRRVAALAGSYRSNSFGLEDDAGTLHLFARRNLAVHPLGRLKISQPRPTVFVTDDDAHVVVTTPLEDVVVKRIAPRALP